MEEMTQKKISILKKDIKDNIIVNDAAVCDICDQLIVVATEAGDTESIAYAHIWKADHYFYVAPDTLKMYDYLQLARQFLNLKKPTELLEKFYTLMQLFYAAIFDNKKSFEYCLEALNTAKALNLNQRIAANYGTIGDIFSKYQCYDEALDYTMRCLDMLVESPDDNSRIIRVVLNNLAELYTIKNDGPAIKRVLGQMEALSLKAEDIQMYLQRAYTNYYSVIGNKEKVNYHIDQLDSCGAFTFPHPHIALEFLASAYTAAEKVKSREYMQKILSLMDPLATEKEISQKLVIQKLKINYYTTFGNKEELQKSYKDYYHLYTCTRTELNDLKVSGMNARLNLVETTQKQRLEEKKVRALENEANYDDLTGMYNRRFLKIKQSEIMRDKTIQSIGFIICDVDYFKEYNDYYGHAAGDDILRETADCLQRHARKTMNVFRYGGDEFICLCWNMNSSELSGYIDDITKDLKERNLSHQKSYCSDRVTLSIGYGNFPLPLKNGIFTVLEEVDQVLYSAKKRGRNCAISNESVKNRSDL